MEKFPIEPARLRLYDEIMHSLYPAYLRKFPQSRIVEILYGRYNVPEFRLMTVEMVRDMRDFMAEQLKERAS